MCEFSSYKKISYQQESPHTASSAQCHSLSLFKVVYDYCCIEIRLKQVGPHARISSLLLVWFLKLIINFILFTKRFTVPNFVLYGPWTPLLFTENSKIWIFLLEIWNQYRSLLSIREILYYYVDHVIVFIYLQKKNFFFETKNDLWHLVALSLSLSL